MPRFLGLSDVSVAGKTVLVRADLNVPFKNGQVKDAARLLAFLPTLKELSEKGAKIVICSHFGRPKGAQKEFSLEPVAQALASLWGHAIAFAPDCVGPCAEEAKALAAR